MCQPTFPPAQRGDATAPGCGSLTDVRSRFMSQKGSLICSPFSRWPAEYVHAEPPLQGHRQFLEPKACDAQGARLVQGRPVQVRDRREADDGLAPYVHHPQSLEKRNGSMLTASCRGTREQRGPAEWADSDL